MSQGWRTRATATLVGLTLAGCATEVTTPGAGSMLASRTLSGIPLEAGPLPVGADELEAAKAAGRITEFDLSASRLQVSYYLESERHWRSALFSLDPEGSVARAQVFLETGGNAQTVGGWSPTRATEADVLGLYRFYHPIRGDTELLVLRTDRPELYLAWDLKRDEPYWLGWLRDPGELEADEDYRSRARILRELDSAVDAGDLADAHAHAQRLAAAPHGPELAAAQARLDAALARRCAQAYAAWRVRWEPADFSARLALLREKRGAVVAHRKAFGERGLSGWREGRELEELVVAGAARREALPPGARAQRHLLGTLPELFAADALGLLPLAAEADAAADEAAARAISEAAFEGRGGLGRAGFEARVGWLRYLLLREQVTAAAGAAQFAKLREELVELQETYREHDPDMVAGWEQNAAATLRERAQAQVLREYADLQARWKATGPAGWAGLFPELERLEVAVNQLDLLELGVGTAERTEWYGHWKNAEQVLLTLATLAEPEDTVLRQAVCRAFLAFHHRLFPLWELAARGDVAPLEELLTLREAFAGEEALGGAFYYRLETAVETEAEACERAGSPLSARVWRWATGDLARGEVALGEVQARAREARALERRYGGSATPLGLFALALGDHRREALGGIALNLWEAEELERVRTQYGSVDGYCRVLTAEARAELRDLAGAALADPTARDAAREALGEVLRRGPDPWCHLWLGLLEETGSDDRAWHLRVAAGLLRPFEPELAEAVVAWERLEAGAFAHPELAAYEALAARSGYRTLRPPQRLEDHRAWRALAEVMPLAARELELIEATWEEALVALYVRPDATSASDRTDRASWLLERVPPVLQGWRIRLALATTDAEQRAALDGIVEGDPLDEDARLKRAGIRLRAGELGGVIDAAVARGTRERDIAWAYSTDLRQGIERALGGPREVFARYRELALEFEQRERWVDAAYTFLRTEEYLREAGLTATNQARLRAGLLAAAAADLAAGGGAPTDVAQLAARFRAVEGHYPDMAASVENAIYRAHVTAEDNDAALEAATRAFRADPKQRQLLWNLAHAGRLAEAPAAVERAWTELQTWSSIERDDLFVLGGAFQHLGSHARARDAYYVGWKSGGDATQVFANRLTQVNDGVLAGLAPGYGVEAPIQVYPRRPELEPLPATLRVLGEDARALLAEGFAADPAYEGVALPTLERWEPAVRFRGETRSLFEGEPLRIERLWVGPNSTVAAVVGVAGALALDVNGVRSPALFQWDEAAGVRFDRFQPRAAIVGDHVFEGTKGRTLLMGTDRYGPYDLCYLPWFTESGFGFFARRGEQALWVTQDGAEELVAGAYGCLQSSAGVRVLLVRPPGAGEGLEVQWSTGAQASYDRFVDFGTRGPQDASAYVLAVRGREPFVAVDGVERALADWRPAEEPFETPQVEVGGGHVLVRSSRGFGGVVWHDGARVAGGGGTHTTAATLSADGSTVAVAHDAVGRWHVAVESVTRRTPEDVELGNGRYGRLYEVLPGSSREAVVVERVVLSDDGRHVAWVANDGSSSALYLDGRELHALATEGGAYRVLSGSLAFTAAGQLCCLVHDGVGRLVLGDELYTFPVSGRRYLRPARRGKRGMRWFTYHAVEGDGGRYRRRFVALDLEVPGG